MSAQQDNLMEELANRDFIPVDEDYSEVVYEKQTSEGTETVTIFLREDTALHDRWNKNGQLIFSSRYYTDKPAQVAQLINSTR